MLLFSKSWNLIGLMGLFLLRVRNQIFTGSAGYKFTGRTFSARKEVFVHWFFERKFGCCLMFWIWNDGKKILKNWFTNQNNSEKTWIELSFIIINHHQGSSQSYFWSWFIPTRFSWWWIASTLLPFPDEDELKNKKYHSGLHLPFFPWISSLKIKPNSRKIMRVHPDFYCFMNSLQKWVNPLSIPFCFFN